MVFSFLQSIDREQYIQNEQLTAFEAALSAAQSVLEHPQSQAQIDDAMKVLHNCWLRIRLKPNEEFLESLFDEEAAVENAELD